jgi:hypothetical protein
VGSLKDNEVKPFLEKLSLGQMEQVFQGKVQKKKEEDAIATLRKEFEKDGNLE